MQKRATIQTFIAVLPLLLTACAAQEPPPYQPKLATVVLAPNGRYVAVPPHCPDWSIPEADTFTNEPASNFGCATEVGLAQTVANPLDLARGAGRQVADGDLASLRVRQYRKGEIAHTVDQKSSSSSSGSGGSQGGSSSGGQN
jgi:hypothetical protein